MTTTGMKIRDMRRVNCPPPTAEATGDERRDERIIRRGGGQAGASTLVPDLLAQLDFNILVRRVEVRPFSLEYKLGRRSFSYTPDLLVELMPYGWERHRTILITVADHETLRLGGDGRYQASRRYCRQEGWLFRVVSDRMTRTPHLDNARALAAWSDRDPTDEEDAFLAEQLSAGGSLTTTQLVGRGVRKGMTARAARDAVMRGIARRVFDVDLTRPFDDATPLVWWRPLRTTHPYDQDTFLRLLTGRRTRLG